MAVAGWPHVIYDQVDDDGTVWAKPAFGYQFVNRQPIWEDMRTQPIPRGVPYEGAPHVWYNGSGGLMPARGYEWITRNNPNDTRVRLLADGTPDADHPNVIWTGNGNVRPALGYHWLSAADNNDFRVQLNEGLVANSNGTVDPKIGYRWVTNNNRLDVRVEPVPHSRSVNATITNEIGNRNAYDYSRVINQFEVGTHPRYAVAQNGATYCNIFAWDVTRAMGAEIPHWIINNDSTGSSAVASDGKFKVAQGQMHEQNVNETMNWLNRFGQYHGWRRISYVEAQPLANEGKPTIAIWANPEGEHGHIAIVRPGSVSDSFESGAAEAQAGSLVNNALHLNEGFNTDDSPKAIEYWTHE
jgi:hypothetical protein